MTIMETDEKFLHLFFTLVAQTSFDKAKEHVDKEKEACKNAQCGMKSLLLAQLHQITLAERSYIEFGFMQTKNKGFLRKDNSLKAVYETLKIEFKRLEDMSKTSNDSFVSDICYNISQFLQARIDMNEFYEKAYVLGANIHVKHQEVFQLINEIIERYTTEFSHITLVPLKSTFSFECEIIAYLLSSFKEIQEHKFLPSLVQIHGAHTRLLAWETNLQTRESWKLGFLKNNPLPALIQWLMKLKGEVLSKFSFYFHNILASQTTMNEMRQQCSKLLIDYYQKMLVFQRKYDIGNIFLLNIKSGDDIDPESAVIVHSSLKPSTHLEAALKILNERRPEIASTDKAIFYYDSTNQLTFVINYIEANIYIVLITDSKKSEKDVYIKNFLSEFCTNLRCTKVFVNLKTFNK